MRHSSLHSKDEHQPYDKSKKSHYHPDEDHYQRVYSALASKLDLESDDYADDPRYQRLLDGLSKKREFESVLEERHMQLE